MTCVFVGDSLTDFCEWDKLLGMPEIVNCGIAGDSTLGLLRRLHHVTSPNPRCVFLMIGINDLIGGRTVDDVARTYERIVSSVREALPAATLFIQSVLPVHPDALEQYVSNEEIEQLNAQLRDIAKRTGCRYVDVASALKDGQGSLDRRFSVDGVHLSAEGYRAWGEVIRPLLCASAR